MMRAFTLLVLGLGACVEPHVTQCADGVTCPGEKVCSPRGGCVTPQEIEQCVTPPADNVCVLPGGELGACYDGVCLRTGCGNGELDPGELCDDGNKLGGDGCSATCSSDERCGNGVLDTALGEGCDCGDASFANTRPQSCNGTANSDAADAICTTTCKIRGCGDGVRAGLEQCDGADMPSTSCAALGYYTGTVGCDGTCHFDTSQCAGRCGNDVIDGPADAEQCDGSDLASRSCTEFGFYYPAGLACNPLCTFDLSSCAGRCGDDVVDSVEDCEPGESEAALAARGLDCTDYGFYAPGGLACKDSCLIDKSGCMTNGGGYCGDGIAQGAEQCDGTDLRGEDCLEFGYYGSSGLACRDNCTFDVAACTGGRCGDGTLDSPEECDGSVPAGTDCTDFGFYQAGGLACTQGCTLSKTGCGGGYCGDNTINGPEDCDGTASYASTCTTFGFYGPSTLSCSSGCTFDTATCTGGICGDSTIDSAEECDGANLAGLDCTDFGFWRQTGLACASCGFVTQACEEFCGDDLVNGPEECDGAPAAANACTSIGLDAGQLGCQSACFTTAAHCKRFGSTFDAASPALNDAWGSNGELFGGGSTTTKLWRLSAGGWTSTTPPVVAPVLGVWGASTSDVFAVGYNAGTTWALERFNGTSWAPMAGPPAVAVTLWDVSGTTGGDVWAVGNSGTVLHFDGASWTKLTTPISSTAVLFGVVAVGAGSAWVVGADGATPLLYHYASGTWTNQAPAVTGSFRAIAARSPTDIYALFAPSGSGIGIYHYGGSSWQPMPMGTCTPAGLQPTGIAVDPVGTVVAVGWTTANIGVVCELAGGMWHRVDDGTLSNQESVAFDGDTFYTLGDAGVSRLSSAGWLALTAPTMVDQNDVWASGLDNLYVAGGSSAPGGGGMRYFNGSAWTSQTVPASPPTNELFGIHGGSSWAVAVGAGGTLIVSNGSGGAWSAQASGVAASLRAVWGDATYVHVVGDSGTILRRPTGGTTWTSLTSAALTTQRLNALWGVSGGDVFAVGDAGTILKYASSTNTWAAQTSGTSATLLDVWGRSASDIYASGAAGVLLHYNGSSWTQVPTGISADLERVTAGTGDLIVTTPSGVLQRAGGRWLPIRTSVPNLHVHAVWSTNDVTVFVRDNTTASDQLLALAGRIFHDATSETVCDDFWDDDGDGLADCADPSCSASPACTNGGGCKPLVDLGNGGTISDTTAGGATRWPSYGTGCVSRDETGRERFYRMRCTKSGSALVSITGSTVDLDLVVSPVTAQGACTPDVSCVASAQTSVTNPSLSFAATANTDYIVIVDGFAGAAGPFTLQVTCPP